MAKSIRAINFSQKSSLHGIWDHVTSKTCMTDTGDLAEILTNAPNAPRGTTPFSIGLHEMLCPVLEGHEEDDLQFFVECKFDFEQGVLLLTPQIFDIQTTKTLRQGAPFDLYRANEEAHSDFEELVKHLIQEFQKTHGIVLDDEEIEHFYVRAIEKREERLLSLIHPDYQRSENDFVSHTFFTIPTEDDELTYFDVGCPTETCPVNALIEAFLTPARIDSIIKERYKWIGKSLLDGFNPDDTVLFFEHTPEDYETLIGALVYRAYRGGIFALDSRAEALEQNPEEENTSPKLVCHMRHPYIM